MPRGDAEVFGPMFSPKAPVERRTSERPVDQDRETTESREEDLQVSTAELRRAFDGSTLSTIGVGRKQIAVGQSFGNMTRK